MARIARQSAVKLCVGAVFVLLLTVLVIVLLKTNKETVRRVGALTPQPVLGAAYAGSGRVVVATATATTTPDAGAGCQHELRSWDTAHSSAPPRVFVLPTGICVGALAWSPSAKGVAVLDGKTGIVHTFLPSSWALQPSAGLAPVAGDWPPPSYDMNKLGSCQLFDMVPSSIIPEGGASGVGDIYVAYGAQCMAVVAARMEPRVGAAFFPTQAPDSVMMQGGVALGGVGGGSLFTAAYLQCLTCGGSMPNTCQQCAAYRSHSGMLLVDAANLKLVETPTTVNASSLLAPVTLGSTLLLAHSADPYPSAGLAVRQQSNLAWMGSLAFDSLSVAPKSSHQAATVMLKAVPFSALGTAELLWGVAVRSTEADTDYSFNTLFVVRVAVMADGSLHPESTVEMSVSDLVKEFSPEIQAVLDSAPLDAAEVFPCFDAANEQVVLAMTIGAADVRTMVGAGVALSMLDGKLSLEAPPSGAFFYSRKFPLIATICMCVLGVVVLLVCVICARVAKKLHHERQEEGWQSLDETMGTLGWAASPKPAAREPGPDAPRPASGAGAASGSGEGGGEGGSEA